MSPAVALNPIPPQWGERLCAFGDCLNMATKTICAEPLRCTDSFCRQAVACDECAGAMAALVHQMLNDPASGVVERTPPEGLFGGHD